MCLCGILDCDPTRNRQYKRCVEMEMKCLLFFSLFQSTQQQKGVMDRPEGEGRNVAYVIHEGLVTVLIHVHKPHN